MTDLVGLKPKVRLALLWHSANSGNLGVGALTIANLDIVRRVALGLGIEPQFTIVGMGDQGARYVSPEDAEVFTVNTRTLLSPSGCWRILAEQDGILDIGAGDSFAEIYGFKRFFFLWLTKAIAVVRGVPLVLSPQTIGPFTRSPYRQMARWVMERARCVVARDDASLRAAKALAPRAKMALSVDVAFALPFDDRSVERGGPRIRVGVNVSGLLYNAASSGKNPFNLSTNYATLMRRLLQALAARPEVEVHLVSHVVAEAMPEDDDGRVSESLRLEFPEAIVAAPFAGPCEAKSYISSLDFLVAGRMHACIAAYSSGVPVVPIAYSRKFSGLFGMLGYEHLVPVEGMTDEVALAFILDRLDRREELAASEREGMSKVQAMLDVYRVEVAGLLQAAVAAQG